MQNPSNHVQEVKKTNFSDPKIEELFYILIKASDSNNLLVKKNLVEMIEAAKSEIEKEACGREKEIEDQRERIAELHSAYKGLAFVGQ